jgi:UDP-glucose 4-epimerase
MKTLVTGSSGHLGEALVRSLRRVGVETVGLDVKPSPFTSVVGSITDRECVKHCMSGVNAVYHSATLHKPHLVTHTMHDFVDANISGTLTLLEQAAIQGVASFVYTSTTSVFGDALRPAEGERAAWVTEEVRPIPRNIYGVTKAAAEDLCRLFHRKHGLNCIVLRTSRFFPEEDDHRETRLAYADANVKANEFLFRRVDLQDVVSAHLLAGEKAAALGFGRYIISATTPFQRKDVADLRNDAPKVLQRRVPGYAEVYQALGWKMFDRIDRVYVNAAARRALQWDPEYDFARVLKTLRDGTEPRSPLAIAVGTKGYHSATFEDGPYPVE